MTENVFSGRTVVSNNSAQYFPSKPNRFYCSVLRTEFTSITGCC